MKLVINEKYINRNKKIGGAIFIANLTILGIGAYFAITGDMTKVYYSWIALVLGFGLTRLSMYFMNRFSRTPRNDEILAEIFNKLRHEYTFFAYASPVNFLLLGPCRMWLPILVTSGGKISFENGKWNHSGVSLFKRLIGQESLARPEQEVAEASKSIQDQLAKHGIPYDQQPALEPIIVLMMTDTTTGDLKDAPYPVVTLPELKRFIRREDRENCPGELSPEENEKLVTALSVKK